MNKALIRMLLIAGGLLVVLPISAALAEGASSVKVSVTVPRLGLKTTAEVVPLLKSADPLARGAAALELGKRKAVEFKPEIRKLLSDDADFVRLDAAQALLQMGDKSVLPTVREVLNHAAATESTRLRAAKMLADNDDQSGTPLARQQATSDRWTHRLAAMHVLAASGDEDLALFALRAGLVDPEVMVRRAAVRALGRLGTSRALRLLQTALVDRDEVVRGVSAVAIANTGLTEAIPVLIALLTSGETVSRGIAATRLNRLTGLKKPSPPVVTLERGKALRAEWEQWWAENQSQFPPGTKIKAGAGAPSASPGPAAQP